MLRRGSKSEAVRNLQENLAALGYNVGIPDGDFGPKTEEAVRSFQRAQGLTADGIAGPVTLHALTSLRARDDSALYDRLRAIIERQGSFSTQPWVMNLLGVRGWQHGTGRVPNDPNKYNDTIYVVYCDEARKHVEAFRATTDPGVIPTGRGNPKGIAHLIDGQYWFKVGSHPIPGGGGRYPALQQDVAVRVWRDANRDAVRQGSEFEESGWFGINIHAGGNTENVGTWSEGCQVLHGDRFSPQWVKFMDLMNRDPNKRVRYTLIDGSVLD